MADVRNRSISIPAESLDKFKQQAAAREMSVSAWLVEAGNRQRARESAEAYAEFMRDPQVRADLASWREFTRPWRA
jgi:hypothetical protein